MAISEESVKVKTSVYFKNLKEKKYNYYTFNIWYLYMQTQANVYSQQINVSHAL